MKGLLLIMAVAVLIEALIEYAQEITKTPHLIASVFIGIVIAYIFKANMFGILGAEVNLYADYVISGILMSRGSNYMHDLVGKLTNKNIE